MIVVKDICKSFGEKQVLDNVSFHLKENEATGIIGLNGAGKTTLLNILSGLIKPDSGFVRVANRENILEDYETLRNIVYISGIKSALWEDLKIKDSFDNCVKMYHIPKEIAAERLEEVINIFELADLLELLPRSMSLGERIRCELAYAMLIRPKILLIDEAMIGIDISVKKKVMTYIKSIIKDNITLLYTSHNLLEIEKLCERIILLDKGKVIYNGSLEKLISKYAPLYKLQAVIEGNIPDMEDLPIEKLTLKKDVLEIVYDKNKIGSKQIISHILGRCKLLDMKLIEPNLEDTIKKIYEK